MIAINVDVGLMRTDIYSSVTMLNASRSPPRAEVGDYRFRCPLSRPLYYVSVFHWNRNTTSHSVHIQHI